MKSTKAPIFQFSKKISGTYIFRKMKFSFSVQSQNVFKYFRRSIKIEFSCLKIVSITQLENFIWKKYFSSILILITFAFEWILLLSDVAYLSFCNLLLGNLSIVSHLTVLIVPPTLSLSVPFPLALLTSLLVSARVPEPVTLQCGN